ncbi:glycosyltransferase family 2 protein [Lysinibacillus antri]|uniref:Glycosyltransferase n=1 Tax=Lysinibacillus antri TaxID=2498145 RepID=A0A3S0QNB5_9BACI|nr:glycosyltransferase [Lysinibacillus antri]RUL48675.1 glycosyltransferase [Lysinibacillus antri]
MKQSNLSVIITGNGENDLESMKIQLSEANKLKGLKEIIFLSECNKEVHRFAIRKGVRVLKLGSKILNHKKRVMGAKIAKGDVLLFLDTSLVIKASELESMVSVIQSKKADLAISTYTSSPKAGIFNSEIVEHIHNIVANRRDLECASLYYVPFVISKEALKDIGIESFAVPSLAKLIAVDKGLKIEVFRISTGSNSKFNSVDIDGECDILLEESMQSLSYWLSRTDKRGKYTNLERRLDILKDQEGKNQYFHLGVTAIIAASNEEDTIGPVIRNAFNAGVSQVVVVDNGSTDNTAKIAKKAGAKIVSIPYRIGHDVGRAVGVMYYPSSYYLFLDADLVIASESLKPFITAITKNGVDVALNNLSSMLGIYEKWDEVTWSKYFLNHALNRDDLDVNTLTAIPNALSNRAVEIIGPENLAIPTVAMVRAILAGLNVKAVKEVDVISNNKVRNEYHRTKKGNLTEQLIIGDMCQGLYELILHKYGRVH